MVNLVWEKIPSTERKLKSLFFMINLIAWAKIGLQAPMDFITQFFSQLMVKYLLRVMATAPLILGNLKLYFKVIYKRFNVIILI